MATKQTAKKGGGRLQIARLTVHDVLGIRDSIVDLDTITVFEGENGSTKSSHLKAIRSALGIDRTSLARLARITEDGKPADEPAVEVLLVGDDREVRVTKKGDHSSEVAERVGADWRAVKRPVEWLRDLVDTQGALPALWLASDDEAKAAAVLEAMPLEGYDRAAALAAAGLEGFRLPPIPDDLHPLEELERIEDAVFSARTQVHGEERREHDAATKLLAGLPAEAPADVAGDVERLERAVSVHAAEVAQEEQAAESALKLADERITSSFKADVAKLRGAQETKQNEIRAAAEKRIAEIRAEAERRVADVKTKTDDEVAAVGTTTQEAREAARATREKARAATEERKAGLARSREELATLRQQQQSIETDRHVRATAAEAEKLAREHHAKAKALTDSIEALKRYRLQLAEQLPIKGLAVKFDEKGRKSLTLDGVPLSQVNDGRLVQLATEVSLLRGARVPNGGPYLPLVLLDGLQDLSPARREALLREVASRGTQVIAAVTTGEPLKVLTSEAVTA